MQHSNKIDKVAIALLVKEFNSKNGRATSALGRMTLQKLLYFLEEAGTPLSYEFEPYYYGPFCEDIYTDTMKLELDNVITDDSVDSERSIYRPGKRMDNYLNENLSVVNRIHENVKRVVHLFSGLLPNDMELAASVHHIYTSLSTSGTAPTKAEVVATIQTWKPGKFTRRDVEHILSELDRCKLLSS